MRKQSFIIFLIIAHLMVPHAVHANSTQTKPRKSLKEQVSEWINENVDMVVAAVAITLVVVFAITSGPKKHTRLPMPKDTDNKSTPSTDTQTDTTEHKPSTKSMFEEGECPVCCEKPNDGLRPLHGETHRCTYAVCNTCLNKKDLYKANGKNGSLINCPACNTYAAKRPNDWEPLRFRNWS